VRELRFHRGLYAGDQVDAALKVYDRFGTFTISEEGEHFVVRLESKNAARERRLAGELANYALGLTIRGRGAS